METIRRARVTDADIVASLVLETGIRFLPLIFGPYVKLILGRLIRTPGTIFHIDNVYVLELEEGRVVGAIVALPGASLKRRAFTTGFTLFSLMGFEFLKRIDTFRLVWSRNKVEKNEFYISNVAVDKNYRGMGYGSKLMKFAERLASEHGLTKLALDVENTNFNAIELYRKLGYRGVKTRRLTIKGQSFVFIRMVKQLETVPSTTHRKPAGSEVRQT